MSDREQDRELEEIVDGNCCLNGLKIPPKSLA